MRRLIPLAGLIVLAATAPSARAATVGCSQQAEARFRNVFHEERSVHVGPLALSGARDIATIDRGLLERLGGYKTPLVLRPGRRVTIAVERDVARLAYGNSAGREFDRLPSTVRFKACNARRSTSRAGRQKVTFWPGAFVLKAGVQCLRLKITVGGAVHRRSLPGARGRRD